MNESSEKDLQSYIDKEEGDGGGHGVGSIVSQLDQVLHNEKEKQLINNFMDEGSDGQQQRKSDLEQMMMDYSRDSDPFSFGVDDKQATKDGRIEESQAKSKKHNVFMSKNVFMQNEPDVRPASSIESIRDSSFFLKQVTNQQDQAFLDIEQQNIEVIHQGKDYSMDESVDASNQKKILKSQM